MLSKADELLANRRRARALPLYGHGHIPADRNLAVSDDTSGFLAVVRLFLRSWPYIRPLFLGRWWRRGQGIETRTAEPVSSEGFEFYYAPILVFAIAIAGPFFEFVPRNEQVYSFPYILLYFPVGWTCIGFALMTMRDSGARTVGTVITVVSVVGINLVSTYVIDGSNDNFYAGALSLGCLVGWIVQYRLHDGKLYFRFRAATHLFYFYAIEFTQRFINLGLGLLTADLLNQNLLQGAPIAPGISELLGVPEWSQGAIEQMSAEQRVELLYIYLQIVIGFYLFQFPIGIAKGYYFMWIMQMINQSLRVALVERWHQLSMNYHNEHRTGDSIFRIYQDSSQVTVVIGHLITLVTQVMSYLASAFLVMLLSPTIGLLTLLIVIPALIWSAYAMPRVRVRSLVYRAAASDVTSTVQESFSGIRLIKAFNNADRAQQKLETDSVVSFNAAYRIRNLIALVTIVMFTIAATFMISGEFFMAYWAHQNEPTFATELIKLVGVSFVVWNLASFEWTKGEFRGAANNIRGLLRNWMTAQDMAMGLRRVFDILDIEPDITDKDDAVPFETLEHEIRFENVLFYYTQDRPVLNDVSFSTEPGMITAIVGPTGAGKSSLMALLLRMFDPQGGRITIDGRSLTDYQVTSLRNNISIALQENVLFAMTVRNNIMYVAPSATEEQVQNAVRVAAMDDYVAGLPKGLETILSDRGGKISSGQKQRLSIARAVVRDTPILILDEPTAALDAATEHKVMANLAEWGKDRAIFLITHRISTIRRADNIIYLDEGRIIESGSHDALMAMPDGQYRNFVEAELNLTNMAKELRDE